MATLRTMNKRRLKNTYRKHFFLFFEHSLSENGELQTHAYSVYGGRVNRYTMRGMANISSF